MQQFRHDDIRHDDYVEQPRQKLNQVDQREIIHRPRVGDDEGHASEAQAPQILPVPFQIAHRNRFKNLVRL